LSTRFQSLGARLTSLDPTTQAALAKNPDGSLPGFEEVDGGLFVLPVNPTNKRVGSLLAHFAHFARFAPYGPLRKVITATIASFLTFSLS